MAGSATLNDDLLVDSLVPTVDALRNDLHAAFGVRHFRVFVVTRTWTGAMPGLGTYTDVELELSPRPLVEPFTELKYKLEPCGLSVAGYIRVKEISLTYTEDELGAPDVPAENVQRFWKISEGHGQSTQTRYFTLKGPPYPDRIKNIGWQAQLQVIEQSAADADLERAPVVTEAGEDVVDIAGDPVWTP